MSQINIITARWAHQWNWVVDNVDHCLRCFRRTVERRRAYREATWKELFKARVLFVNIFAGSKYGARMGALYLTTKFLRRIGNEDPRSCLKLFHCFRGTLKTHRTTTEVVFYCFVYATYTKYSNHWPEATGSIITNPSTNARSHIPQCKRVRLSVNRTQHFSPFRFRCCKKSHNAAWTHFLQFTVFTPSVILCVILSRKYHIVTSSGDLFVMSLTQKVAYQNIEAQKT